MLPLCSGHCSGVLQGMNAARSADGRLSLAECRSLLPPDYEVDDQQLERVRDDLYALAEAIVDAGGQSLTHMRATPSSGTPGRSRASGKRGGTMSVIAKNSDDPGIDQDPHLPAEEHVMDPDQWMKDAKRTGQIRRDHRRLGGTRQGAGLTIKAFAFAVSGGEVYNASQTMVTPSPEPLPGPPPASPSQPEPRPGTPPYTPLPPNPPEPQPGTPPYMPPAPNPPEPAPGTPPYVPPPGPPAARTSITRQPPRSTWRP